MEPLQSVYWTAVDTPIGAMQIASTRQGVCKVALPNEVGEPFFRWLTATFPKAELFESPAANQNAIEQLLAYLHGQLTAFNLSLDMRGSDFQRAVWAAVARVPYGETRSYADIAREVGRPKACRAVGVANSMNPLPPFIPCHRIIGKDGALVGYGGGLDLKARLLQMERTVCGG